MDKPVMTTQYSDSLWTPTDPLGEALHLFRMRSVFYSRAEVSAPWSVSLPAMKDCLMFHVVNSGKCWLKVNNNSSRYIGEGELVLIPHGKGHIIASDQGIEPVNLFDIPREKVSERYETIYHEGGGESARIICGAVRFSHPAAQYLVELLPELIHIESWNLTQMNWMQSTLRLMADEASTLRPGGETVITRLADILVIQAIRSWIENEPAAQIGWLAALQDKQIGQSILRIHQNPQHQWSVNNLATAVAMSRSAYAARFKEIVGMSPMQYVLRWRMKLAQMWIESENVSIASAADRLGYQSEAAFSRAFKRINGTTPGAARRCGTSEQTFPSNA